MWPERRYWRWNLRIWLLLAFAFLVVGTFSGGAGVIYVLTLWTEVWIIVSVTVWFVLCAGHLITRAFRHLASPS